MKKADRNDTLGIEMYGAEKWNLRCDYEDNKNERKERVFAEASKTENMCKLFDLINDFVGEDMDFHYTVDVGRQTINIASDVDLSDRPFLRLAWKDFHIENFSSGLGCSEPYYCEDRDYGKPVEKVFYWMEIQYSYHHIKGGSNGASIGTALFGEDGKWTFVSDIERYGKEEEAE